MKTLVKTVSFFAALVAAVACGGNSGQKTAAAPGMPGADVIPNVTVTTATSRDVPQEGSYSSTVLAYAVNNIAPQSAGRIRKINVEVGDYVSAGTVVAEMDRLSLEQTRLQLVNDSTEYVRLKTLFDEGGLSKSDFEAFELAYKVRQATYKNLLENTVLRSPVSGFVTARNYDKNDMYAMAMPIFTVQQVVPVKLLVGISESEYTRVKRGDKVTITVDALPGRSFTGKVNRLYPTIDAATHTFNAEVIVPNTDRVLRPGMYARVTVTFGVNRSIVLPDQAIVKQEGTGQRFVYVLQEDGTVRYLPVGTGLHIGSEMEITSGLSEGDRVVVKGQAALKDGVKVQVLNQ